jgi:hypothetical protein
MTLEFENLDKFVSEIEKLKKAHKLLERVWLSHGTYRLREYLSDGLYPEIINEIEKYFDFDDSE